MSALALVFYGCSDDEGVPGSASVEEISLENADISGSYTFVEFKRQDVPVLENVNGMRLDLMSSKTAVLYNETGAIDEGTWENSIKTGRLQITLNGRSDYAPYLSTAPWIVKEVTPKQMIWVSEEEMPTTAVLSRLPRKTDYIFGKKIV